MMTVQVDSVETLQMMPTSVDVAFSLNRAIAEKLPHFIDLTPFRTSYDATVGKIGSLYIYRIEDTAGRSQTNVRGLSDDERAFLTSIETDLSKASGPALYEVLGPKWIAWNKFTYVGQLSWMHELPKHMGPQLFKWADTVLIPSLVMINQHRAKLSSPAILSLNRPHIMAALWILESEKECIQGTAFCLEGVGVVTAAHVLAEDSLAFQAVEGAKPQPINILRRNDAIDLAVITFDGPLGVRVTQAPSDHVETLDPVAIAGFPNYCKGDSGTIVTGNVSGFRMKSAIRRVLVDAPIIAGNSGGPVFNRDGLVIGVAVTGADFPTNVAKTEEHSFVPISALGLF